MSIDKYIISIRPIGYDEGHFRAIYYVIDFYLFELFIPESWEKYGIGWVDQSIPPNNFFGNTKTIYNTYWEGIRTKEVWQKIVDLSCSYIGIPTKVVYSDQNAVPYREAVKNQSYFNIPLPKLDRYSCYRWFTECNFNTIYKLYELVEKIEKEFDEKELDSHGCPKFEYQINSPIHFLTVIKRYLIDSRIIGERDYFNPSPELIDIFLKKHNDYVKNKT